MVSGVLEAAKAELEKLYPKSTVTVQGIVGTYGGTSYIFRVTPQTSKPGLFYDDGYGLLGGGASLATFTMTSFPANCGVRVLSSLSLPSKWDPKFVEIINNVIVGLVRDSGQRLIVATTAESYGNQVKFFQEMEGWEKTEWLSYPLGMHGSPITGWAYYLGEKKKAAKKKEDGKDAEKA